MLPLPVPERGGSIDALRPFLNLSNQNDFVLIVACPLIALRSGGPYPLLAISGEQGSAKTVLSKLLRALVDPNVAAVRALPREERELMIAANNGRLLASIICPACPPGSPTQSAGLRAVAVSRSVSSTLITRRCCLKRPGLSS
jgi:hypothetical protein